MPSLSEKDRVSLCSFTFSDGPRSARQPPPDRPTHSATCPKPKCLRAPLRPQLPPPPKRQTPLESTPTQPPTTVDSKPLTATLNPLSATLTKAWGGGRYSDRYYRTPIILGYFRAAAEANPSACITASCSAGRTCWILAFSRVGCTRFVSSTTKSCRSGSIQIEVPVNPVCPKLCAEK